MFERYTEKARRSIFFARYEASQYGSPHIETEHILLGLLREDQRIRQAGELAELVRKRIEESYTSRSKVPTSVDLPLSNEAKRVLAYAAEEAERLAHKHVGTEHLLLGILREEGSFAAMLLREGGFNLEKAREWSQSLAPAPCGIAGASVITRSRPEFVIEFVCDGKVIAGSYSEIAGIPRRGERVLLMNEDGNGESYRVKSLTYTYERIPYEGDIPQHRIEKITVDLEPE